VLLRHQLGVVVVNELQVSLLDLGFSFLALGGNEGDPKELDDGLPPVLDPHLFGDLLPLQTALLRNQGDKFGLVLNR